MATTTRETTAPQRYMQGVSVPAESVNPARFFALTRRHIATEKVVSYAGQTQEIVELRKSDILSGITVRFSGTLTTAKGTGTVGTTRQWPYNLVKQARFTANGASNLINASGLALKVRDMMKRADLTDRGIAQTIGAATVSHGTLALASESWGVGSGASNIADGAYPVELEWFIPVAEDEQDLAGAIFLATSSSDLTLAFDLAANAELFALTANATATLTGSIHVSTTKFSIPIDNGQIVVPDLSLFHSLIQTRQTDVAVGENEHRLVGQGAGKSLLRTFFQVWNGTGAAAAPLQMSAANFGKLAYRYATNETPDEFLNGQHMRVDEERRYNCDVGGVWGFGCHDFAHENAFRDVLDMGTAGELRLVTQIGSGVTLTSPALVYVTETMHLSGQAA